MLRWIQSTRTPGYAISDVTLGKCVFFTLWRKSFPRKVREKGKFFTFSSPLNPECESVGESVCERVLLRAYKVYTHTNASLSFSVREKSA